MQSNRFANVLSRSIERDKGKLRYSTFLPEFMFNDNNLDSKHGKIWVYHLISYESRTNQIGRKVLSFGNDINHHIVSMN